MQRLTEEQIKLFEKLEKEGVPSKRKKADITDEECDELIERHLKITTASSGGLYPNCSVIGGSCSGC